MNQKLLDLCNEFMNLDLIEDRYEYSPEDFQKAYSLTQQEAEDLYNMVKYYFRHDCENHSFFLAIQYDKQGEEVRQIKTDSCFMPLNEAWQLLSDQMGHHIDIDDSFFEVRRYRLDDVPPNWWGKE